MLAAFKTAWHRADEAGDTGNRGDFIRDLEV